MRRYIAFNLFGILILLISCSKETNFPILNPDPLIQIYKENKISHFKKITNWADTVFSIDSIKLNRNGYITYKHGWYTERFVYDSLNRVIEEQNRSDVPYHDKNIKYEVYNNYVVQRLDENNITIFCFDQNMRFLRDKYFVSGNDTILHTHYSYNNSGKIKSIVEHNLQENRVNPVTYHYKLGKLFRIDDVGEIQYVSPKTGLIDSSEYMMRKASYIYFKY